MYFSFSVFLSTRRESAFLILALRVTPTIVSGPHTSRSLTIVAYTAGDLRSFTISVIIYLSFFGLSTRLPSFLKSPTFTVKNSVLVKLSWHSRCLIILFRLTFILHKSSCFSPVLKCLWQFSLIFKRTLSKARMMECYCKTRGRK